MAGAGRGHTHISGWRRVPWLHKYVRVQGEVIHIYLTGVVSPDYIGPWRVQGEVIHIYLTGVVSPDYIGPWRVQGEVIHIYPTSIMSPDYIRTWLVQAEVRYLLLWMVCVDESRLIRCALLHGYVIASHVISVLIIRSVKGRSRLNVREYSFSWGR